VAPRLVVFLLLASTPAWASSWTGVLVDSKCYAGEQRNVNPTDTSLADRDMDLELRYCSPTPKTKTFAVVLQDWSSLQFDSAGDAMSGALFRKAGQKPYFSVVVTGERTRATLAVKSIAAAR